MENYEKILPYVSAHYDEQDYGALAHQYAQWVETKPLSGLRILDATPLFRNTLLKYRNLLAAGAELTIGLSDVISHNGEALLFAVEQLGLQTTRKQGSFDIVLDCAGVFATSEIRIGAVELTRSGVDYYKKSNITTFVADSSRIKEIETEFGTGESLIRAMRQLGYTDFSDKVVTIFGSGKVGRGLLRQVLLQGCRVRVVSDPDKAPRSCDLIDYRDRKAVEKAVRESWAVVMATGVRGALEKTIDPTVAIRSDALLINMGAEDEFGESFPKGRLLENGRTLNFILQEPTHLRFIDPTMALHNYGAQFLIENKNLTGIVLPTKIMEQNILATTSLKDLINK